MWNRGVCSQGSQTEIQLSKVGRVTKDDSKFTCCSYGLTALVQVGFDVL